VTDPWWGFENVRLSIGAWLVSPGAGVLAAFGAVAAGWFAYLGVQRGLAADQARAEEARKAEAEVRATAERHARWQWYYEFLWANREQLPPAALKAGVQSLVGAVETESQTWQLDGLTRWIDEHAKRRSGGRR
jgi:hypothetical protein